MTTNTTVDHFAQPSVPAGPLQPRFYGRDKLVITKMKDTNGETMDVYLIPQTNLRHSLSNDTNALWLAALHELKAMEILCMGTRNLTEEKDEAFGNMTMFDIWLNNFIEDDVFYLSDIPAMLVIGPCGKEKIPLVEEEQKAIDMRNRFRWISTILSPSPRFGQPNL